MFRSKRSVAALCAAALVSVLFATTGTSSANPISGAIFTTVANGSEVNFNIYAAKTDVYLNGGPGLGAPLGAAGLPDGTYVFQVTDPSGKTLLSTDAAACRQVTVVGGVFSSVSPSGGCAHLTSTGQDGSTTVQLMPYLDTPNNGGEYKVWVSPVANFLANCSALGVTNGLAVVDCGSAAGNQHGFTGADSKTDNFKVKSKSTVEIDTQFKSETSGQWIDHLAVTWTDTTGTANNKYSYLDAGHLVNHQAHVEGPEAGTHHITISDQAGCTIDAISVNGAFQWATGTQDVAVTIKPGSKTTNIVISCL
jgi:hypothetical protein